MSNENHQKSTSSGFQNGLNTGFQPACKAPDYCSSLNRDELK